MRAELARVICAVGTAGVLSACGGEDVASRNHPTPDASTGTDAGTEASVTDASPDGETHEVGDADAASPGLDADAPELGVDAGAPVEGGADADASCADEDGDGVCDLDDRCPGADDREDTDGDGRPDGCEPVLLFDAEKNTAASSPSEVTTLDDTLFFLASVHVGDDDRGLFRVRRTPGGLLSEVTPIGGGDFDAAHGLGVAWGKLYFFNRDRETGEQSLWTVGPDDDTAVRSPVPVPAYAQTTTVVGDVLFFTQEWSPDLSLWRTDGTADGTFALHSGPAGFLHKPLIPLGSLVFFLSFDGSARPGLFRTDGTVDGTYPVLVLDDLDTGRIVGTAAVGDRLYFLVYRNHVMYPALWSTDGTVAGTGEASNALPADVNILSLKGVGGRPFVTTGRAVAPFRNVWSGTAMPLERLDPGGIWVDDITDVNGIAYMHADRMLWLSDGTQVGTQHVGDFPAAIQEVLPAPTGAYLITGEPDGEKTLRHTSTTGEAVDLGQVFFDPYNFNFNTRAPWGDSLVFMRDTAEHGREAWITTGARASTRLIADINTDTLDSRPGTFIGGRPGGVPLAFSATTTSSSTTATTAPFARLISGANPAGGPISGITTFVRPWLSVDGYELFVDGSAQGEIRRLAPDGSVITVPAPIEAVSWDSRFLATSGEHLLFWAGQDLLYASVRDVTDSTPSLLSAVRLPLAPGSVTGTPISAVEWNGAHWFAAGGGLFRVQGDAGEAGRIASNMAGGPLVALENGVYFLAPNQDELQRVDLTSGVQTVWNLADEGLSSARLHPVSFGGHVYLTVYGGDPADERLYRTDGSTMELVVDAPVRSLTPLGERLLLMDAIGRMFVSDGSPGGTSELLDGGCALEIVPAVYRNAVYFARVTPESSSDLWRSDGTAAGTYMEADLNPGGRGGVSGAFHVTADALYFRAWTRAIGDEPWVMRH